MNFPNLKRNNSFILTFFFSIFHLCFFNSLAQDYPPSEKIHDIKWESYKTATNIPKYLIPFNDPITQNKVTRISDKDVFGCDCEALRHRYAKNQPWNADGTKIMTAGSYAKILDGKTYKILATVSPRALWSNTDPNITFDGGGNKFYKKNIVTNSEIILHTFSEYESVEVGYGEGNISNDDRWVALIAKKGKNQTVLVYDILSDAIVGSKFLGTIPLDWVSVSQSGKFVVIRFKQNGKDKNQGIKSYNQKMQNETHLLSLGAHGDLGFDIEGNEVFVSIGRYNGYSLSYTRLDNGFTKGLWRSAWKPGDRGASGGHVSTRNLKRPGWAYISTDQTSFYDITYFKAPKEIFAIKLDNSETIQRFAKHRTNYEGARSEYNHQTHAVPNRDGTKVIFASNWNNSEWRRNRYPMMFVVETNQNSTKITANAGQDTQACQGATTTLTVTGGSTYLWNTGAKTASIQVSPDETTLYTVAAYDASGQNTDTDEVKVTVLPSPNVDAGSNLTIKVGETATLTASGADSYKWSTGETTASITVSPNTTKTFSVIGRKNNCEVSDSVTVFLVDASVKANAGQDISKCLGIAATLTATGGVTYLWNTGATTASIRINPGTSRTYTVTAYDSTGKNSDTDQVYVTVNPLPAVNAGKDITINAGESATLGATGATDYEWSTGIAGTSLTVTPKTTTTYTVTGTTNGCEASDTVKVTVLTGTKIVANAGNDITKCLGIAATLTATGGVTYLWNTGATTASIRINPGTSRTYTVTAYDSTGKNSDTDQVYVTVNPLPSVDAGNNMTINAGESISLTATGATVYEWSTGATTASITVNPDASKTYTVIGVKNGCEATDKVTVIVINSAKVVAKAGVDQTICNGSSTTLTATGGDTYIWSTGAKTESISVSPASKTSYSVTAFVGEASGTDEVVVSVDAKPNVTIKNGAEETMLEGEFITLSASGADTYKWSNGATKSNIAVSPRVTKSFEVTGFLNDCTDQKSIQVNVFKKVIANAGNDVTICNTEKTVLTASGPDNTEYLWSTGETTKSITVDPKEDTEYSVMVYHALDSDTDNVMVKVENCSTPEQITEESIKITEESKELEFLIYPNPTYGEVKIKVSGLTNLSSIHIYDLSGKSLYNEIINEGDQQNYLKTLNLSDYASGVYLLQLVDNERVITKKVVLR